MNEINKKNGNDKIDIRIEEKKDVIPKEDILLKNMTLREKLGQMVIMGVGGATLSEEEKIFIEENNIGGVILFGRNITSGEQLKKLTEDIENSNKKYGMFISTDEEGGRVSRLPEKKVKVPSNYFLGNMNNPEIAYEMARVIGEELSHFGINTDFAPVLDVWSNPANTVIGDRSYSSNADVVAEYGVRAIKGFKDKGIISFAKHFPGHGDTVVDSHVGLPTVDMSYEELEKRELVPFKKAIDSDAEGIMVAHLLVPKVDSSGVPASLSKRLVSDILRKELGFEGVVITDDLEMGAIKKNYEIHEACELAVKAGVDILLICHDRGAVKKTIDYLYECVKEERIKEENIDESVKRILRLKVEYELIEGNL